MKRILNRKQKIRHPLEVNSDDDDFENIESRGYRSQDRSRLNDSQTLTPSTPAVDEQDRKRVVGCLASLLSTKSYSSQFKRKFLEKIVAYLEVDDSVAKAYLPLTDNESNSSWNGQEYIKIFLDDLESVDTIIWCIIRFLLMSDSGYDARVRTIFRDLYTILYKRNVGSFSSTSCSSPSAESVSSESSFEQEYEFVDNLASLLFEHIEHLISSNLILFNVQRQRQEENNAEAGGKKDKMDIKKMAKITGFSILAGTAFAITGGLAAPGIAAGVAVVSEKMIMPYFRTLNLFLILFSFTVHNLSGCFNFNCCYINHIRCRWWWTCCSQNEETHCWFN